MADDTTAEGAGSGEGDRPSSDCEAETTTNNGEDGQAPFPPSQHEVLEDEDRRPPPPAQPARRELEVMDDDAGPPLPPEFQEDNSEMDEEAGMAPRNAPKGAPTMVDDDGPVLPPSFQEDNATKKPFNKLGRNNVGENQLYPAQRGENTRGTQRGHTRGAATAAPPSRPIPRAAWRVEHVSGGILRRLAGISARPPHRLSEPDASAGRMRHGNINEPDPSIPILEATLVEDEILPARGPVYEATAVPDPETPPWYRRRQKCLIGVSAAILVAVIVALGVQLSRGDPPPLLSGANSTGLFTLKYYADKPSRLCTKDGSERAGGERGANFYLTIADCCKNEFWHPLDDECMMSSFGITHVPSSAPSYSHSYSLETQLQSSTPRLFTSEDVVGGHSSTENVAIRGNIAVVGAPYNDNKTGTVFILKRVENRWLQLAKLKAPDVEVRDRFGYSVAIDGNAVVVGVCGEYDSAGSAHVFERNRRLWMHQAELLAPGVAADDRFGCSVDISQNRVIVGAHKDNSTGTIAGAAYIFTQNNTTWTLESKLLAPKDDARDGFGRSVGIFNDTITVPENNGGVHIYSRSSGGPWEHHAKLSSLGPSYGDRFWWSVGIHGNRVIVGAPYDESNGRRAGASFIFSNERSSWTLETKLFAPDGAVGDFFGRSVDIFEGTAIVGSPLDDDNGFNSGSAYLFELIRGAWLHRAKLLAPDAAANDKFGHSVAVHNGTVIAHSEGSGETFAFLE